jgi:hypothetical protein
MRKLLKTIIWTALLLPLALLIAIPLLLLSNQPSLTFAAPQANQQDAFTQILRKQQRELRFGNPVINVSDTDLNLLINHAIQQSRFRNQIALQIALDNQSGKLLATADTHLPIKPFINLAVLFHFNKREPIIDSATIGAVQLPDWVATSLVNFIAQGLFQSRSGATWQRLFDAIQTVDINNHQINLHYGIDNTNAPSLIDAKGNNVIAFYQIALLEAFPQGGKIPLTDALQKMFTLAKSRTDKGANAVTENTAAIVTLGLQVAPENLLDLFGIAERPSGTHSFSIERQRDLGKHFLNSAFLTIYGGRQLANLAGIYKELVDMQLRQDFNIRDLAANQAGIRFAYIAIDPHFAKDVQTLMANNHDEHFILPSTKELDDNLKKQLENVANHKQGDLQRTVRNKVGEFVEQAPLYRQLNP